MISLISLRIRTLQSRIRIDHTVVAIAAVAALAVLAFYVNVLNESVDRGARLRSAGCWATMTEADGEPRRACRG